MYVIVGFKAKIVVIGQCLHRVSMESQLPKWRMENFPRGVIFLFFQLKMRVSNSRLRNMIFVSK